MDDYLNFNMPSIQQQVQQPLHQQTFEKDHRNSNFNDYIMVITSADIDQQQYQSKTENDPQPDINYNNDQNNNSNKVSHQDQSSLLTNKRVEYLPLIKPIHTANQNHYRSSSETKTLYTSSRLNTTQTRHSANVSSNIKNLMIRKLELTRARQKNSSISLLGSPTNRSIPLPLVQNQSSQYEQLVRNKNFIQKANFKKLPIDTKVDIPVLASFYSFLADVSMKKTVYLNVPETVIIDLDIVPEHNGFGYLYNVQGKEISRHKLGIFQFHSPEIAQKIQQLKFERYSRIKEAKPIITEWFQQNLKKITQNNQRSIMNSNQEVFIPLSISKQRRRKNNHQNLDFFIQSSFYRLKNCAQKASDFYIQRYIPAKSNKNSVMRVVWINGQFKMFLISAHKSYDGTFQHSSYKPPKTPHNNQNSVRQATSNFNPDAQKKAPEILNADYIYQIQQKLEQLADLNPRNINQMRQQKLQKKKFIYIQEEIDRVNEFQYQYCTSDKYPERNYIQVVNNSIQQFPEIIYQAYVVIELMNSYIKRHQISRSLTLVCVDFIHDYTDGRWKFLNLKHFESQEVEGSLEAEMLLIETPTHKDKLHKQVNNYGLTKEEANYLKRSKCVGDYCNIKFDSGDFMEVKFGYLRDALKILAIDRDKKKEVQVYKDDKFMHRRNMSVKNANGSMGKDQQAQNKIQEFVTAKSVEQDLKFVDISADDKFHYRIMKRGIYLDRMRRKEILQGRMPDLELFPQVDLDKKDIHESILLDLLNQLYKDRSFLHLKERAKHFTLNFYSNAYVCIKCFQIYQFLQTVYQRQEEYYVRMQILERSQLRKNIFFGMNHELNSKIVSIVQEKIEKAKKAPKGEARLMSRIRLTSLSPIRSLNINQKSLDLTRIFKVRSKIDSFSSDCSHRDQAKSHSHTKQQSRQKSLFDQREVTFDLKAKTNVLITPFDTQNLTPFRESLTPIDSKKESAILNTNNLRVETNSSQLYSKKQSLQIQDSSGLNSMKSFLQPSAREGHQKETNKKALPKNKFQTKAKHNLPQPASSRPKKSRSPSKHEVKRETQESDDNQASHDSKAMHAYTILAHHQKNKASQVTQISSNNNNEMRTSLNSILEYSYIQNTQEQNDNKHLTHSPQIENDTKQGESQDTFARDVSQSAQKKIKIKKKKRKVKKHYSVQIIQPQVFSMTPFHIKNYQPLLFKQLIGRRLNKQPGQDSAEKKKPKGLQRDKVKVTDQTLVNRSCLQLSDDLERAITEQVGDEDHTTTLNEQQVMPLNSQENKLCDEHDKEIERINQKLVKQVQDRVPVRLVRSVVDHYREADGQGLNLQMNKPESTDEAQDSFKIINQEQNSHIQTSNQVDQQIQRTPINKTLPFQNILSSKQPNLDEQQLLGKEKQQIVGNQLQQEDLMNLQVQAFGVINQAFVNSNQILEQQYSLPFDDEEEDYNLEKIALIKDHYTDDEFEVISEYHTQSIEQQTSPGQKGSSINM